MVFILWARRHAGAEMAAHALVSLIMYSFILWERGHTGTANGGAVSL